MVLNCFDILFNIIYFSIYIFISLYIYRLTY